MPNSDEQQKIFVVFEAGAEWPAKLDLAGLGDIHIVAQQAAEPKLELARRVEARLSRGHRSNGNVVAAVFVVGPGLNYSDVQARWAIARTLATGLTWKPGSELTLTGKGLSSESCAHLSSLALALEYELRNEVHIQVQTEAPQPARAEGATAHSGISARVGMMRGARNRRPKGRNQPSSLAFDAPAAPLITAHGTGVTR